MPLEAPERIALIQSDAFQQKIMAALLTKVYAKITTPTALEDPERFKELAGFYRLYNDPKFLSDFVSRVTLFFVGAASVIASGLETSAADLETIAGEVLDALEEFTELGGAWYV